MALSWYNVLGQHLRDVKRRNTAVQSIVSSSDASFKITALPAKQTNNAEYLLLLGSGTSKKEDKSLTLFLEKLFFC